MGIQVPVRVRVREGTRTSVDFVGNGAPVDGWCHRGSVSTFLRRRETYHGVSGVAYRAQGGYATDLQADVGDIARSLGTSVGGTPEGLLGLPGNSGDEELDARRDWGVWAPDAFATRVEQGLADFGHVVVDDPT